MEAKENPVKTIAVIGAGPAGPSIALASILAGFQTVLEDVSRQSIERAVEWIQQQLAETAALNSAGSGNNKPGGNNETKNEVAGTPEKALAFLTTATKIEDAIRDADLIIEAVPDELEMKLELFTIFDKFAKPGAIFASTSTALSVGDITDVTIFRERCIGMRFLNYGANTGLIELVRTPLTSDETLAVCQEVALRLASEVIFREEVPGSAQASLDRA